jgi:GPH family glycoside/pentoside/hexuronide:cation symporter/probable glucitol transport protein GutA
MSLFTSVREGLAKVKNEWRIPAKGNYVSYREIVALGIGGMGPQFGGELYGRMGLGADSQIMGQALGLRPMEMQTVGNFQGLLQLLWTVIRAKIVDNTRTRWGRFRPYIATMGFFLVAVSIIFIFLPFHSMTYSTTFIAAIIVTQICSMTGAFYTDTHNDLVTVITPNSEERAKIIAIYQFLLSLAPSIIGVVVPYLMNNYGRYTDIEGYRKVITPFAVIGVCFSLITAVFCKERIITPKSYVQKVGILKGAIEIYGNRYWLCRQISGWIGFAEGFAGNLLSWYFIYSVQNTRLQSVANLILPLAWNFGFIFTPILLKRLGNRAVLLLHNGLNVLFVGAMVFFFNNPIIMIFFMFLNNAANSLNSVYESALHSDTKDYQQYLSGRRMDFTFGVAGALGVPISMITNMVKPWIYERVGITSNYDIMYDSAVRNQLFTILCFLSVVGALLNLVPLFFYTLSRQRHRNIIRVLRYRALFDDYAEGTLEPEGIVEAVENHRRVMEIQDASPPDFANLKAEIARAKTIPNVARQEREAAVKAARNAFWDAKDLAEEKKEIHYYLDEVEKFRLPEIQQRIADAKKLMSIGLQGLKDIDDGVLQTALALPGRTKEEKAIRSEELRYAQNLIKMARAIPKAYPNGVEVPNKDEWDRATKMPEDTKEQRKAKGVAVKAAEKRLQIYHTVLQPWIEAEKLLARAEMSDTLFAKVGEMYPAALEEIERKQTEQQAQAERENEGKDARKTIGKK